MAGVLSKTMNERGWHYRNWTYRQRAEHIVGEGDGWTYISRERVVDLVAMAYRNGYHAATQKWRARMKKETGSAAPIRRHPSKSRGSDIAEDKPVTRVAARFGADMASAARLSDETSEGAK